MTSSFSQSSGARGLKPGRWQGRARPGRTLLPLAGSRSSPAFLGTSWLAAGALRCPSLSRGFSPPRVSSLTVTRGMCLPIPNSCVEAVTPSITVCGWRCGLWKGVGCTRGREAGAPWCHEQRHGEFAGSLSLRVGGQREGGRPEARKRAPIRTPHAGTRSRLPASRAAESQLLFELPCGVSRACERGDVGRTVRRCPRGKERAPGRI